MIYVFHEKNMSQQTFFGLEDALKTSSRHVLKTSSKSLQRNNFSSSRRFSSCAEGLFKTCLEDVSKTSWRQTKCLLGEKNCFLLDSISNKSKVTTIHKIFETNSSFHVK